MWNKYHLEIFGKLSCGGDGRRECWVLLLAVQSKIYRWFYIRCPIFVWTSKQKKNQPPGSVRVHACTYRFSTCPWVRRAFFLFDLSLTWLRNGFGVCDACETKSKSKKKPSLLGRSPQIQMSSFSQHVLSLSFLNFTKYMAFYSVH